MSVAINFFLLWIKRKTKRFPVDSYLKTLVPTFGSRKQIRKKNPTYYALCLVHCNMCVYRFPFLLDGFSILENTLLTLPIYKWNCSICSVLFELSVIVSRYITNVSYVCSVSSTETAELLIYWLIILRKKTPLSGQFLWLIEITIRKILRM